MISYIFVAQDIWTKPETTHTSHAAWSDVMLWRRGGCWPCNESRDGLVCVSLTKPWPWVIKGRAEVIFESGHRVLSTTWHVSNVTTYVSQVKLLLLFVRGVTHFLLLFWPWICLLLLLFGGLPVAAVLDVQINRIVDNFNFLCGKNLVATVAPRFLNLVANSIFQSPLATGRVFFHTPDWETWNTK